MWATVVAVILFALLIKSVVSNMDIHKENVTLRAKLQQQQIVIFNLTQTNENHKNLSNNEGRKNLSNLRIFDPNREINL